MSFAKVKVKPGRIYILRNPLHQDALVKIGYTQSASEARASSLSKATGVPSAFEVMYEEDVADCEVAEKLVHEALHTYRVNPNREFFQVPIKVAVRTVFDVCLRVNSALIREKCRLIIWLKPGAHSYAKELKDLLLPWHGGDTSVHLVYRNERAEAELRLPDANMVHCSPRLLRELNQKPWVEEVCLSVPTEKI